MFSAQCDANTGVVIAVVTPPVKTATQVGQKIVIIDADFGSVKPGDVVDLSKAVTVSEYEAGLYSTDD